MLDVHLVKFSVSYLLLTALLPTAQGLPFKPPTLSPPLYHPRTLNGLQPNSLQPERLQPPG